MNPISAPDYSQMSMCELRAYFTTLSLVSETLVAQMSRPLTGGTESCLCGWLEDATANMDNLMVDLVDYLKGARLQGADEKFRLCMLIEYEARLADSVEAVARTLREAIVPVNMLNAA